MTCWWCGLREEPGDVHGVVESTPEGATVSCAVQMRIHHPSQLFRIEGLTNDPPKPGIDPAT